MSTETSAKIKVEADTGGAVPELDKATRATDGLKTSAKAAGAEQKALAGEMKAGRAVINDARKAIDDAAQASRDAALAERAYGKDSKEAAAATKAAAAAHRAAERAAEASAAEVRRLRAEVDKTRTETNATTPAMRRLEAQLDQAGDAADRQAQALRRMQLEQLAAARAADKGGRSMGAFMASFAGNVAANAVSHLTEGLREGVVWALETGASYETLRTSLETVTGSSAKAALEFERLQRFAAATPYAVAEVTDAYIKLANRGITPTDRAMTAFGNTASAMGKTLDDFVEAVADAVTGENERLKEFGIVGKLAGDQVAYTFRGVTTMVKRDAASIQEYLTRIGEANFAGGMEKQSQSLAGKWSTLQDQAAGLADKFTQGLAPALKTVMDSFSGGGPEADAFAKRLGEDIGQAVRVAAEALHLLIGAVQLVSDGFHALGDVVEGSNDIIVQATEYQRWMNGEMGQLEEAAIEATRAMDGQRSTMVEWMQATTLTAQAQRDLADATRVAARAAWEASIQKARIDEKAANSARYTAAALADQEAKKKNAERRAMETELAAMPETGLSPSEKKRRDKLAKDLDVNIVKPKKGKKAPKDPTKGARDEMDFDADVATYQAKLAKELRAENVKDQAKAWEAEERLHERRAENFDRELEMIEARGLAEEDAAAAREDLLNRRLAADEAFAAHQQEMAATAEQREQAQTRMEAAEHAKRLASLRRQTATEQREQATRAAMFAKVHGHIMGLGETLVAASWAQAEGEKGAIAESVAAYAKGVAQKMTLKGLEETALGAAALAGIVTAGLAAPHFAAAGLAFAAAAAAGLAGVGFSALASSQKGGGGSPAASPFGAGPTANGPGGSAEQERQQLQKLNDIPLSKEADRRSATASPNRQAAGGGARGGGGNTYNITVLGATEPQVGEALERVVGRTDFRSGSRAAS